MKVPTMHRYLGADGGLSKMFGATALKPLDSTIPMSVAWFCTVDQLLDFRLLSFKVSAVR